MTDQCNEHGGLLQPNSCAVCAKIVAAQESSRGDSLASSTGSAPGPSVESEIDARFKEWWRTYEGPFTHEQSAKFAFMCGFLIGSSAEGKAQNARLTCGDESERGTNK